MDSASIYDCCSLPYLLSRISSCCFGLLASAFDCHLTFIGVFEWSPDRGLQLPVFGCVCDCLIFFEFVEFESLLEG